MALGNLNQVKLMGNLGGDPEIRRTQDGTPVCTLSVATSESWVDKQSGERKERVEWHRVIVWGKAESGGLVGMIEKWLAKGDKVLVEGMLQTRKWQDKDGVDKYTTEVIVRRFCDSLQIITSKKMDKNRADRPAGPPIDQTPGRDDSNMPPVGAQSQAAMPDDDIPF